MYENRDMGEAAMKPKYVYFSNVVIILISLFFLSCGIKEAEFDWPRWRGPNGDGISLETDWNPEALNGVPKILWHINIGLGHSNVAIESGRLYTMGLIRDGQLVVCLDAKTGEELWRYKIDKTREPQATPIIVGKHLYTLSYNGDLVCLTAKKGRLVWRRELLKDFGAPRPTYGYGTSPSVEGDLVVINTKNTGIALSKKTGETVWEGQAHPASKENDFSTPVFYSHNGRRCVLIFSFPGLFAMDHHTGEQIWYFEWMKEGSPNVADPVLFDGKVFISSSETDSRGAVLDISGAEPKLVWENQNMTNHISTSVYLDGYLYGADGDYYLNIKRCTLRCVDANTGELMWQEETGGASLTAANGKLIVLTAKGTLRVVEASPSAYMEISSCDLPAESGLHWWWTNPVLCNSKIYCRNFSGDLVCIDVSK
jgi:outer membrane protein assembly factor BamB